MKPLIEEEFRKWKPDFAIEDFRKEFTLSCLTIHRFDTGPARGNWHSPPFMIAITS